LCASLRFLAPSRRRLPSPRPADAINPAAPNPPAALPANFADQFFRHDSGKEEESPTVESIDEAIAALEARIAEKKELRKAVLAEAERMAQEEAEKAAKQAVVDELKKAAAEAEQKLAEAQAKLAAASV
jgi:chromosome segregation ATPase